MIADQIDVLNASFSGQTGPGAADTPFQFVLQETTWTENADWYTVVPAKAGVETDTKQALYEGDARTLDVYAANIGGGLLGWAYFPKGYNNGRDFIDGIVILDESMPGGDVGKYSLRRHAHARGRPLADARAHVRPRVLSLRRLGGRHAARGDAAVRLSRRGGHVRRARGGPDPRLHGLLAGLLHVDVHAGGQADRMSDAWLQFRAGGGKGSA